MIKLKNYILNDYSKRKEFNDEFIDSLNDKQLEFFSNLNIDLNKIEIDKKIYNIDDEKGNHQRITRYLINFLIEGDFVKIPKYQKEIYSDEELNLNVPNSIKVSIDTDNLATYEIDNLHIVFKHPYFHYDDQRYKEWDCHQILGSILKIIEE